jgi:NADPH:quinone reductase-like Zn-dependent oxidoreductase
MKAVRIHAYGGPDVLRYEDAPRPEPQRGELLIRVHACGVNPVDWKTREGYLKEFITYSMPMIPGWDFSGVVEAADSGATRLKRGNEVFCFQGLGRPGAYAEYVAVPQETVALKPKSLDYVHAAALPVAGLTAWQALFDVAKLRAGQKLLVHAAAGGVGSVAVQLARWKGAYVIGTASARNQAFLKELGADQAIDYEHARFESVVHDVNAVFDTIGGETQKRSFEVLKKGGILVSVVSAPSAEEAARRGVREAHMMVQPNAAQLAELARLADSGKLKVNVETVLPLQEARRAQEMSQAGHTRGKIVLRVI